MRTRGCNQIWSPLTLYESVLYYTVPEQTFCRALLPPIETAIPSRHMYIICVSGRLDLNFFDQAMRQEFPLITKQESSMLLPESVMVGASVKYHPQISDAVLKSTELQIRLRQVESLLLCAARIEDQLPGAVHRNAVYTFEKKPLVFVLL
jgi:hypothetical protein